jgi:hypothetical protein
MTPINQKVAGRAPCEDPHPFQHTTIGCLGVIDESQPTGIHKYATRNYLNQRFLINSLT